MKHFDDYTDTLNYIVNSAVELDGLLQHTDVPLEQLITYADKLFTTVTEMFPKKYYSETSKDFQMLMYDILKLRNELFSYKYIVQTFGVEFDTEYFEQYANDVSSFTHLNEIVFDMDTLAHRELLRVCLGNIDAPLEVKLYITSFIDKISDFDNKITKDARQEELREAYEKLLDEFHQNWFASDAVRNSAFFCTLAGKLTCISLALMDWFHTCNKKSDPDWKYYRLCKSTIEDIIDYARDAELAYYDGYF